MTRSRLTVPSALFLALALGCGPSSSDCPPGFETAGSLCVAKEGAEGELLDAAADGAAESILDATTSRANEAGADAAQSSLDAGDAATEDVEKPTHCYLDHDGDGVGAGSPTPCETSDAGLPGDAGKLVARGDDCDDNDPERSPLKAEVCDEIDNDCDEVVNNGVTNVCGGSCLTTFANPPGQACNNGLKGACARSGEYACTGAETTACNAPEVTPTGELCGDSIDNDCDGNTDEPVDAVDAVTYYQDCDADGYAGSPLGALRACTPPAAGAAPAPAGCKAWTIKVPNESARQDWDCDPNDPRINPTQAEFFISLYVPTADVNCDGVKELEPGYSGSTRRCTEAEVQAVNSNGVTTCNFPAWTSPCLVWGAGTYYATKPVVGLSHTCPDRPVVITVDNIGACKASLYPDAAWACR